VTSRYDTHPSSWCRACATTSRSIGKRCWSKSCPRRSQCRRFEHDKLNCAARVAALDAALAKIDGPVILVAHSAGVMITVHWARQHSRKIHGALLAASGRPRDADAGRLSSLRCARPERLAADSTKATAVSEHRRCQPQTIRSRSSSVSRRWRKTGAVGSSTLAKPVT